MGVFKYFSLCCFIIVLLLASPRVIQAGHTCPIAIHQYCDPNISSATICWDACTDDGFASHPCGTCTPAGYQCINNSCQLPPTATTAPAPTATIAPQPTEALPTAAPAPTATPVPAPTATPAPSYGTPYGTPVITPPNCNTTPSCTGTCTGALTNTCSANNGTQGGCTYTTYSGGGSCTTVAAPNQACTQNNCSTGYTCSSGSCIDSTAPIAGILTINSNATYTNTTAVTLNLGSLTAATDGVGITGYYASENSTAPIATAAGWQAITSTTSYTANVSFPLSAANGLKTVFVWYKDSAGNVSSAASDSITLDTIRPTVSSITSINQCGYYIAGNTMPLDVNVSELVHVTTGFFSVPYLRLVTKDSPRSTTNANYTSNTGSNTLYFDGYTAASGDNTSGLNYDGINALVIPAGSAIKDAAGNDITTTLPNPTNPISCGGTPPPYIVIDAVAPTVTIDTLPPSVNLSNHTAVPVGGTCSENGRVVSLTVTGNGSPAATGGSAAPVCTSGSWSASLNLSSPANVASETLTFTVTHSDAAGNSDTKTGITRTKDTIAPSPPSIPDLDGSTDSGLSITDNFTNITTPTFFGNTEADSTITILRDGVPQTPINTTYITNTWITTLDTQSPTGTAPNHSPGASYSAVATDLVGNSSLPSSGLSVVIDTTFPSVTSAGVSATNSNGSYKAGVNIDVLVPFNENVHISAGLPQMRLVVRPAFTRDVSYYYGSGTTTLYYRYTVQVGDTSSDLNYYDSASLILNAGTIQDTAGNNANITLPATIAANSLAGNKDIIIDTTPPSVSIATIPAYINLSNHTAVPVGGTCSENGRVVSLTVTGNGSPAATGGSAAPVCTSGSWSASLNLSSPANVVSETLTFTATHSDVAGNSDTKTGITRTKDTIAPAISSISSINQCGDYKAGNNIDIKTVFNEAVNITGIPQLTVETNNPTIGSTSNKNYLSGTGSTDIIFRYTIASGDNSSFKVFSPLSLNGGTIQDSVGNNASLTFTPSPYTVSCSLGTGTTIIVDTTAPTVNSFTANFLNPNVIINWTVSDSGGSNLKQVEVWKAPYNSTNCNDTNKSGCAWIVVNTTNAPASSDGPWSFSYSESPSDGTYWYGMHVVDNANNVSVEPYPPGPIKVIVDKPAPSVTSFSVTPQYPTWVDKFTYNSKVTVQATVSDTGGSYLKQWEVWRAPYNDTTCNDTNKSGCAWIVVGNPVSAPASSNGPWSPSFADTPSDGTYWYGMHVLDNANNVSVEPYPPGPIKVRVDITDPVISIYAASPTYPLWANVQSPDITIGWTVTDAAGGSNLQKVDVYRSPYNSTNCNDTIKTGCPFTDRIGTFLVPATNPTSWSASTINTPPDGTYWYVISVDDNARNFKEQIISPKVQVDKTAPTVAIITLPSSVNISNNLAVNIGGTCTSGDGNVTVTVGTGGANSIVCNATGLWSATLDLSNNTTYPQGTLTVAASQTDAAGNPGYAPSRPLFKDTIAPAVNNISSVNQCGNYKAGNNIDIKTVFNEAVNITGTPQLTVETNNPTIGSTSNKNYLSGTGSTDIIFRYTIASGDNSSFKVFSPLSLNGGTIRDNVGNNASLTFTPSPYTVSCSLGTGTTIIVDTTPPNVTIDTLPPSVNLSNHTAVPVGGTCSENGRLVSLTVTGTAPHNTSGSAIPTCGAAASGRWSASLDLSSPASVASETLTFTAIQTDAAGNISSVATDTRTKDTVAPSPPGGPGALAGTAIDLCRNTTAPCAENSDTGQFNTDNNTSDTTPTFKGTSDAGTTITVFRTQGATTISQLPTTIADSTGNWILTLNSQAATGTAPTHTPGASYSAVATDSAGNSSPASAGLSVVIDTTNPQVGIDASVPFYANIARSSSFSVSGTCEANLSVVITTPVSATTPCTASGTFSINLNLETPVDISEGVFTITARQDDIAGNPGTGTKGGFKDTVRPISASAVAITAATDTGKLNTDGITNVTTPNWTWTAGSDPGGVSSSGINHYELSGTTASSFTTSATAWTQTPALADSSYTLTIQTFDNAGNESASGATSSVTIDTQAPSPISILINNGVPYTTNATANGLNLSCLDRGLSTNCWMMQFSDTNLASSYTAEEAYATIKAPYTLQPPGDGVKTVYAKFRDVANNQSSVVSDTIILDGTKPTISAFSVSPTGTTCANITSPNVTIGWTVSDTGGSNLQKVEVWRAPDVSGNPGTWSLANPINAPGPPANPDGPWFSSYSESPANGTYWYGIHVVDNATQFTTETDAGFLAQKVIVDKTAPAAPSTPDLHPTTDTGNITIAGYDSDNITKERNLRFTGTAEAGSTIRMSRDATTLTTTTTASLGNWDLTVEIQPNGDPPYTASYTAKATDTCLNPSVASGGLSVTVDNQAPVPSITTIPAYVNNNNQQLPTHDDQATVNIGGTCASGDGNVTVQVRSTPFTAACTIGSWSTTLNLSSDAEFPQGLLSVLVTQTDTAGNITIPAAAGSMIKDTVAPTTPSQPDLDPASDSGVPIADNITSDTTPTFTGTAETNSTVRVYRGGTPQTPTTTATAGSWNTTLSTQATTGTAPTHTPGASFTATATDAALNESVQSSGLTVVIDTTAPAVTQVTSPNADANPTVAHTAIHPPHNGYYHAGEILTITSTFNELVFVTGTPALTLETGAADQVVNYSSGTGTAILTFSPYTVQAGDNSIDLNYASTSALSTTPPITNITDTAGNNYNSAAGLPALASANSLAGNKNLIIDTTKPVLTFSAPTVYVNRQNQDTFTITGTCTENDTVSKRVTITITQPSGGTALPAFFPDCLSSNWSQTIDFNPAIGSYLDGTYAVRVEQTDLASNTGFATASIIKDTGVPTATIQNLADSCYSNNTAQGVAPNDPNRKWDNTTGGRLINVSVPNSSQATNITRVDLRLSVDSTPETIVASPISTTQQGTSDTWQSAGLPLPVAGTVYIFRTRAEDQAGNTTCTKPDSELVELPCPESNQWVENKRFLANSAVCINPWLKTTEGDVHSNKQIDAPGGP